MTLSWWDIPGPGRFVRRVENDLQDRLNVVAALPAGMGRFWFDYFRRQWMDGQQHIEVMHVDGDERPPLDILCEAFATNPDQTTTIWALVKESTFQGRTLAIFLEDVNAVRTWADFLTSYERECHQIDPLDRTVVLLATEGVVPKHLPSPEKCLRVHVYDGYARTNDCYMYAWGLLGSEDKQAWRTELKMALCAQLAQWDHRLCEALADQDIGSILRKITSVAALPAGKGFDANGDPDEGWARGFLQRRDGETIVHSGVAAQNETSREFERRVWTAQIQVVFPLIEQLRLQAIDKYKGQFQMPVRVGDSEYVNDPYELEIAMVRRIVSRLRAPQRVNRRLDNAYRSRNALAHLVPLTAQAIQEFEPTLDGNL